MSNPELVAVYDSRSEDYRRAFDVFLAHTDQKVNAKGWLDRLIESIPSRNVFIDAGAGNGAVTAWYTDRFSQTIAIEPNEWLRNQLAQACPLSTILPEPILDAEPRERGDMVLCSHVFYYIDAEEWLAHLERLASWVSAEGVLVVALQNEGTDCMKLLDHFAGYRFSLSRLTERFQEMHQNRYQATIETVNATVSTPDLETAYTVAEFMLNLLPLPNPPAKSDVEHYLRTHFQQSDGSYRFSCHQDFLQVRRQPVAERPAEMIGETEH